MNIVIKLPRYRVPDTGHFVQIRHDFETVKWAYMPRAMSIGYGANNPTGSYPDTSFLSGMKPNDFAPLSQAWQQAWYNALDAASEYKFLDLPLHWTRLTAHGVCFTDNHAVSQGFTDYITGQNLAADNPIQVKSLGLGGNICKVVGEDANRWYVEAFDMSKPPPVIDMSETWRVHVATQSTILKNGNQWRVLPFPQLSGFDVPYFLPSFGGVNKLDKAWAKPIPNGAQYSPYENYNKT